MLAAGVGEMTVQQSRCGVEAGVLVVAAATLLLFIDTARSGGPAYPTLQDYYQGPYGFFTHWSGAAAPEDDGKVSLGYAVCNVDAKQPLYFYWDAPAFGTGWNYPLQLGACATMMRSAIKATVDDKALITFTQHNQKRGAKAYLPNDVPQLPQQWFSRLIGFFTMPGSDPRIVDISVRVRADEKNHVTYVLTWFQGIRDLAVGFDLDGLPEAVQGQILTSLERSGVKARFAKAKEFVSDSDREHLPTKVSEANYLVMSLPNTFVARFEYDPPAVSPGTQPVIITDDQRRVVAVGSYTSAR